MAAMEQVAAEVLPAGMGYAWSDMSYQEKKAEGGQAIVFGMSIFCVFLILAATLRELVSALQRTFVGSCGRPRGKCRTAITQAR